MFIKANGYGSRIFDFIRLQFSISACKYFILLNVTGSYLASVSFCEYYVFTQSFETEQRIVKNFHFYFIIHKFQ